MSRVLSNAHMHTTFCDGKNTCEEMLQAAIDRGFVSAGFSIHAWTPYDNSTARPENEFLYRKEIRRLQSVYAGKIEVLLGIERDALYDSDVSEYEFYIDSTHFFMKDGERICIDYSRDRAVENVEKYFGGDWYAYSRAYFEREAEVCSHSNATFIGHIDLVTKYNEGNRYFDADSPDYLIPALDCVECALERHIPIEMNTGAISRGYRTAPYPSIPLLKRIRERKGEILINSDAHSAAGIDLAFDDCEQIALSCGFDHVLRLRSFGLEEVPLK